MIRPTLSSLRRHPMMQARTLKPSLLHFTEGRIRCISSRRGGELGSGAKGRQPETSHRRLRTRRSARSQVNLRFSRPNRCPTEEPSGGSVEITGPDVASSKFCDTTTKAPHKGCRVSGSKPTLTRSTPKGCAHRRAFGQRQNDAGLDSPTVWPLCTLSRQGDEAILPVEIVSDSY